MKQSKKQIVADTRRKMATEYKVQHETYERRINAWQDRYAVLEKESDALHSENVKLKEKIQQLEDWNERLMSFMDLSDADRKQALTEWRTAGKYNEYIVKLYQKLGLESVFEL